MKIYIETPLTDEILEGLKDKELYYVLIDNYLKALTPGSVLKVFIGNVTHILLPKEISDSDIEKEAREYHFDYCLGKPIPKSGWRGFIEGAKWALSIKETK